jgi:hypothetical protein
MPECCFVDRNQTNNKEETKKSAEKQNFGSRNSGCCHFNKNSGQAKQKRRKDN